VVGQCEGIVADLDEGWATMEPNEGVLFSSSGLVIQKGGQAMQLKATYQLVRGVRTTKNGVMDLLRVNPERRTKWPSCSVQ
jgi:hypothetical protein